MDDDITPEDIEAIRQADREVLVELYRERLAELRKRNKALTERR